MRRSSLLRALAVTIVTTALVSVLARDALALSYVALGDSIAVGAGDAGGGGYVARFRDDAAADLEQPIALQNLAVGGTTSADLLTTLTTDMAVRAAVAAADVVTFDIGGNDVLIALFSFTGGTCGGADGQDCLRDAVTGFQSNWPAILTELRALNPGAMMRTMTYYNPAIVDLQPGDGTAAALKPHLSAVNDTIAATAPAFGVDVADGPLAFNGRSGGEDPIAKGYLDADHIHPSPLGYDVLAAAFHALGYPPIAGALVRIPSSMALRDDVGPPSDPTKRKLTLGSATRKGGAPGNRVVLPPAGGPNDPRVAGAVLTIYNAAGSTTDHTELALPAAGWSLAGTDGFAFKGGAPLTRALVKRDKLKLLLKGAFDYSLDEPAQGAVAVRLTFAGGGWCAAASAKVSGSPPSTAASDRPGRFIGTKNAPAPASCPAEGSATATPTPATTPTPTSTATPSVPSCNSGSCGGCGSCGDGFCAIEASPPGCTHNGVGDVCVSNGGCAVSACTSDVDCGSGKVCIHTAGTFCCSVCP